MCLCADARRHINICSMSARILYKNKSENCMKRTYENKQSKQTANKMCDFSWTETVRVATTLPATPSLCGTLEEKTIRNQWDPWTTLRTCTGTLQRSGVGDRLRHGRKMHVLFPSLTVLLACVAGADGKYVGRCQQAAFKVTLAARHFNMGRKFTSPVWGLTLSAADTRLEQQRALSIWHSSVCPLTLH